MNECKVNIIMKWALTNNSWFADLQSALKGMKRRISSLIRCRRYDKGEKVFQYSLNNWNSWNVSSFSEFLWSYSINVRFVRWHKGIPIKIFEGIKNIRCKGIENFFTVYWIYISQPHDRPIYLLTYYLKFHIPYYILTELCHNCYE